LSGLSGLGVIARSSAIQYKGTDKPLKQIAEELGVDYALMGTVRWEKTGGTEDRVRVNPELIKIADATQVWSQPFEAAYSGSFKLQSQIASQVASELGISLLATEQQTLNAPLTENSEAYDFYLKGNEYLEGAEGKVSLAFAEQMFNRALELDPRFAAAYAKLSKVYSDFYWYQWDRSEKRVGEAKRLAETALSLDPNLALAHTAMAWYHYHTKLDYESGLESFRKSISLQPNNVDALRGIGAILRRQGKLEESLPYFEKAVNIDPRSRVNLRELAYTQDFLGKPAEAVRTYDLSIAIAPDDITGYFNKLGVVVRWKADLDEARSIAATVEQRKVPDPDRLMGFMGSWIEYLDRNYRNADEILRSLGPVAMNEQFFFIPTSYLRGIMARLMGDIGRATEFFDSARVMLENGIHSDPEDSRLHSSLGLTLAGLGRKEEAIREARKAVDLMPVSKEAFRGAVRLSDLARVYSIVGEKELALDQLEKRKEIPWLVSYGELLLDPVWDPLRKDPRFENLLKNAKLD